MLITIRVGMEAQRAETRNKIGSHSNRHEETERNIIKKCYTDQALSPHVSDFYVTIETNVSAFSSRENFEGERKVRETAHVHQSRGEKCSREIVCINLS